MFRECANLLARNRLAIVLVGPHSPQRGSIPSAEACAGMARMNASYIDPRHLVLRTSQGHDASIDEAAARHGLFYPKDLDPSHKLESAEIRRNSAVARPKY